jgi:CelD/BcsL family acetyltransferase involved in cellulose biosynthesis
LRLSGAIDIDATAKLALTTRVRRQVGEIQALASDWGELSRECPQATPFQGPEWLLSWIEVFRPVPAAVVEVRDEGRLVGLAAFLIYRRESQLVLAFAGGGVSDYLDVLALPGRELEIVRAIRSTVEAEPDWTNFELTDIPPRSPLLAVAEFGPYIAAHDNSSVLPLPRTSEELLHRFSKRQRANLRNARSRLERAGGGSVELAGPPTLGEFLDDLFRLHRWRWSKAGQAGVLADERVRAFHALAAPRLLARGILRLYRLRLENRTVAAIYALFQGATAYCYVQGFDPEFSSLSPGNLLLYSVIEEAMRAGIENFDFLRGLETYKEHWRPKMRTTYRITLARAESALPGAA